MSAEAKATGNVYKYKGQSEPVYNSEESQLYFEFQTQSGELFSIGLKTILQCLKFAEDQGEIPKHSYRCNWVSQIINQYSINLDEDTV